MKALFKGALYLLVFLFILGAIGSFFVDDETDQQSAGATTTAAARPTTTTVQDLSSADLPTVAGDSDADSVRVAQLLVGTFSEPISVDGSWGAQTSAAVAKLRLELGLAEEGDIDAALWKVALERIDAAEAISNFGATAITTHQNIQLPSGLLPIEAKETPDVSVSRKYVAPQAADQEKVVERVQELNAPKTFGNWKYCTTSNGGLPAEFKRFWWNSAGRKLGVSVKQERGRVTVTVTEEFAGSLDGCNGYKPKVTATTKPAASAQPSTWYPDGYDLYDFDIAYRFMKPGEFSCSYGDTCWAIMVVSLGGCSSLYVEITVLDSAGVNIGYTNDLRNNVRAGEPVRMTFEDFTPGASKARIAEINCF